MHISYKPLWHTLVDNMGKGKNISMETLVRICEALNCGILDVIELEQDEISVDKQKNN